MRVIGNAAVSKPLVISEPFIVAISGSNCGQLVQQKRFVAKKAIEEIKVEIKEHAEAVAELEGNSD